MNNSSPTTALLCHVQALYRACGAFLAAEGQANDMEWLRVARRVVWAWGSAGEIELARAMTALAEVVGRPESEDEI